MRRQVKITAASFTFRFAKDPANVSGSDAVTDSLEEELTPQHKEDALSGLSVQPEVRPVPEV